MQFKEQSDDNEPIKLDWLLQSGFKPVKSDMGENYRDHMELEGFNVWEFNDTGDWLFNDADHISMRTKGEIRMLASLLKIKTIF